MGVLIRLERSRTSGTLPSFDVVVRGKNGIRGGLLETIGSCRLFGAYKIFYIRKERLAYWLGEGAVCSKRVVKELIKHGVSRG
jgi:ribosomal protein S16